MECDGTPSCFRNCRPLAPRNHSPTAKATPHHIPTSMSKDPATQAAIFSCYKSCSGRPSTASKSSSSSQPACRPLVLWLAAPAREPCQVSSARPDLPLPRAPASRGHPLLQESPGAGRQELPRPSRRRQVPRLAVVSCCPWPYRACWHLPQATFSRLAGEAAARTARHRLRAPSQLARHRDASMLPTPNTISQPLWKSSARHSRPSASRSRRASWRRTATPTGPTTLRTRTPSSCGPSRSRTWCRW